jgi:hypothetical protein
MQQDVMGLQISWFGNAAKNHRTPRSKNKNFARQYRAACARRRNRRAGVRLQFDATGMITIDVLPRAHRDLGVDVTAACASGRGLRIQAGTRW